MSYLNGFIFAATVGYLAASTFGGLVGIAIYTGIIEVVFLFSSFRSTKTTTYIL